MICNRASQSAGSPDLGTASVRNAPTERNAFSFAFRWIEDGRRGWIRTTDLLLIRQSI